METVLQKSSWHGPKQVKVMIYCGLMFAIGSCLVSGFNNTIFPWIAEANSWDVYALYRLGGYSALLTPIGVIVTTKLMDKLGVKLVNTVALILAAIVMFLLGFAPSAGYLKDVNQMLLRLRGWGAQITSDEDGNIVTFGFGDSPHLNAGINLFALDNLRQTGEKMGINFINHVDITYLIKVGDKVCGAVGFDIYDGSFIIIKAKAVIVCCGGNGYMGTRMFTNNGEGRPSSGNMFRLF